MPGEVIPPGALSPRSATILIVEDDAAIGHFLEFEADGYGDLLQGFSP